MNASYSVQLTGRKVVIQLSMEVVTLITHVDFGLEDAHPLEKVLIHRKYMYTNSHSKEFNLLQPTISNTKGIKINISEKTTVITAKNKLVLKKIVCFTATKTQNVKAYNTGNLAIIVIRHQKHLKSWSHILKIRQLIYIVKRF